MPTNKKVAIVEDDLFLRQLYENKISEAGYEVVTAEDGEAGLAMIIQTKPDLVLLDITMPKMDGWEVLAEIRKLPALADLKVVFLTNEDRPEDRQFAQDLKVDDYLIKAQVLPSEVLLKVKALIG